MKEIMHRADHVTVDGKWGWVVVASACLSYFIADGWTYSFGVFYPELLDYFHDGNGKTAVIGAMLMGIPLVFSPFICAIVSVYGCRKTAMFGGFLTGISMVISTFAPSIEFLYFSVGILGALGLGMTYVPSIMCVTHNFEKKRGLAIGLTVMGSGLGGFAFPPLLGWILELYTWRGAILILGAICFNIIPCAMLYKIPPQPPPSLINDENKERDDNSPDKCYVETYQFEMTASCRTSDTSESTLTSSYPRLLQYPDMVPVVTGKSAIIAQVQSDGSETTPLVRDSVTYNSTDESVRDDITKRMSFSLESSESLTASLRNKLFPYMLPPEMACDKHSHASQASEQLSIHENKDHQNVKITLVNGIKSIFRNIFDRTLLSNWSYVLYCLQNVIMYLWIAVPFVYLVHKALLDGVSKTNAALLLSVISISRIVGQILIGMLGDSPRVSTVGLYTFCIMMMGIMTSMVPILKTYETLCVYAVVFGFFYSAVYSLQMLCLIDIIGLQRLTQAFGLMQLGEGVASLLGTPITGWLYDATEDYDPAFYTGGGLILFSGFLLVPIILVKVFKNTT